jgi:hypothetical protein
MKKLVLSIVLLYTVNTNAQTTGIPDANFEQALIDLGYDAALDGSVLTANISSVTSLNLYSLNISDLTGIEDFTALTYLVCDWNQLTSLDVSQNTVLSILDCGWNQLTFLDVSGATALAGLNCDNNNLTSLDLTQNTALDVLDCHTNQLQCLNVKNGNNSNFSELFWTMNNPNLYCIEVDDVTYSTVNWTNIDAQSSFSTYCGNACTTGIEELYSGEIELVKVVDLMGRETTPQKNRVLIYIYSDGTAERVLEFE